MTYHTAPLWSFLKEGPCEAKDERSKAVGPVFQESIVEVLL